jgi:hypothetical protein
MTTETMPAVLTDEQIRQIALDAGCSPVFDDGALVYQLCRDVEQAVLQSPEIQTLRKKAAMIDFLEQHQGADISVLMGGEWEVCGSEIYGTGASLSEAFDAAMEQKP